MDYEKKYKEALGRAKKLYEQGTITESLSYVFDELAESEDERIRKWLIDTIKQVPNDSIEWETIDKSYVLAWLEKQKDYVSPQMIADAYLRGCNDTEKKWLEKQCEQDDYDDNIITRDDEILQAISVGLTDVAKDAGWSDFGGIPIEDIMAWLEKQGEQKPFDYENANIQQNDFAPKFKLGDWIVWKDKCYKVNDNGCGYELIDTNDLSTSLEYETVDENARLWTIADAKDGDVLVASDDSIFIYTGVVSNGSCMYYIAFTDNSISTNFGLVYHWERFDAVKPATKEQCDTLFTKMHEAGYEWNAEKKELRNIETPKECLCISPDEYNKVVNECWRRNKSKWTEEDEELLQHCCCAIAVVDYYTLEDKEEMETWLKSLKKKMEE